MTENIIRTVKVRNIRYECEGVKTLTFNIKNGCYENYIPPKPGQFVMIWVPGIDEVPMSLSGYDDNGNWSITVKNVGECTSAIHNLKIGDYIGVRGPFGNSFPLPSHKNKKIFLIGGGIGVAALKALSKELIHKGITFVIIEGAKIDKDLMYRDEFQVYNEDFAEFHYCTDDGSYGNKGFASEIFERLLEEENIDNFSNYVVYACGPEIMLYKVFQICERNQIEYFASLERIMRCGSGLCGLCAMDPLGLLVCKDGPIFGSEVLRELEDFGKFKRDFSGKKIPID